MTDVALAIRAQMDAAEATAGFSEISDAATTMSDQVTDSASAASDAAAEYAGLADSAKGVSGASRLASGSLKAVAGGLDALGFSGASDVLNQVATGVTTLSGVSKAFTAVQAGMNAVLAANPLLLIVLAVVALVAVLVIAYKRSETFRDIVNGAFHGVAAVVGEVVEFIKDHWRLLLAILTGPIGIAVGLISKHWETIQAGAIAVVDWVKDRWPVIRDLVTAPFKDAKTAISDVWDKITSTITAAKGTIGTVMGDVKAAVQTVVDVFQAVLNKVNDVLHAIAKIHVPHVDLNPFNNDRTAADSDRLAGLPPKGDVHLHVHMPDRGSVFVGSEAQLAAKLKGVLGRDSRRLLGLAGG